MGPVSTANPGDVGAYEAGYGTGVVVEGASVVWGAVKALPKLVGGAGRLVKGLRNFFRTSTDELAGQKRGLASKPTTNAYDEALAGGRHAGFAENYAGRSTDEIERAIRSLQKQADDHLEWIENPYQHVPDFDKLDPRQQQALVTEKWPSDIQRLQEQIDILQGVLERR